MPLITIVQDYIRAAMMNALLEDLDDGTVAATVPNCFGVVALGADVRECMANLSICLEDWVHVGLAKGLQLPVIDGIDVNSEAARSLASCPDGRPTPVSGELFENEEQFEAALTRWESEQ